MTSRDWRYKPAYLAEYYCDFGDVDDTESKMKERAGDVFLAIVTRWDIGALEWYYFNWILPNDLPHNSMFDNMLAKYKCCDDRQEYDFIEAYVCWFCNGDSAKLNQLESQDVQLSIEKNH
jgi:hypothetical protein